MPSVKPHLFRSSILRERISISPVLLTVLAIAFVFSVDNSTFWYIASDVFSGHLLSLVGYMGAVFCLTLGAFSLFAFPWTVKPFLISMLILAAMTSYYVDTLGIIVDRDMIQNVMVTTVAESKHLITLGYVTHVVVFGVFPSLFVMWVRIPPQRRVKAALTPILTCVLSLSLATGLLMADLKSYSSILRERKDFMSSYQPGAPLVGAIRYAKMMSRSANLVLTSTGLDARAGSAYDAPQKPMLTIVVAGETARAQNFSLNGYDVDTNPELSKLPIINFSNTHSCGTATAVSLPCMFSKFSRDSYTFEKGTSTENVLDVLGHAGLHVEWWDNNTGDKTIAARFDTRTLTNLKNPEFCATGECIDGIFLEPLKEYIASVNKDTVLVLHQIGSHGPTYYQRYPAEFERFKPACRTAEFKKCTPMEITNAYDNTIAYTDQMIARTINMLAANEGLATSLIYVSDHGESLGERGLYLHGAPYFMAPETQTHVPMILWMSDAFQSRFSIDESCVAKQKDKALSHDNLFHSLLGLLDIHTAERNPNLDIFTPCKTNIQVAKI
ncbi:phosphoethanolamine--lipid A transferase [uncultured Sulfitobacter sp.]|uniref:phosphoethanolamine transferase n=1 Tax=uncultured Sulfitobacter sp. TaxID=191468 RepID=UPI0030F877D2